uniref:BED-type domain-containing protein n=1 Tax=Anopheles funestus TaxID=62324 RepID=A0A4Y0BIY4_ANOFN
MDDSTNNRYGTRSAANPTQLAEASTTIKQEPIDEDVPDSRPKEPSAATMQQEASSSNCSSRDPLADEIEFGETGISFQNAFFNVVGNEIKTENIIAEEIEDNGDIVGSSTKRRKICEEDSGDDSSATRSTQQSIVPMSAKFSDVWLHFVVQGKAAKCRYCGKFISMSNRSTSNLKRHIKNLHPSIPFNRAAPMESSTSTTSKYEIAMIEPGTSKNQKSNPVSDTNVVEQCKPMSLMQNRQLDEALFQMICDECLPFNIVEGEKFKKFIHLLNPNYEPPSRKMLSNGLLTSNYLEALEKITANFTKIKSVALTSEGWLNYNNTNCLAITAHYINEDFSLCSNLLECSIYSNEHTARHIADWLKQVVLKYKIENKVQAIITNNEANMQIAINEMNVQHLPCFAHTLNSLVQNAIQQSIKATVDEVKTIVTFFKNNSNASQKLLEAQNKHNLSSFKLKQDVGTRWNSTFDMIERFHKNKIPILLCLDALKVNNNVSDNDWTIMEQSIEVLLNFDHATKVLSAEKSVPLSQIGLLSNILLTKTQAALNDGMDDTVKKLTSSLIQGLSDGCKPYIKSKLVSWAMMLDPRMKGHSFESDSQRYEETYRHLIEVIIPLKTPNTSALGAVARKPFANPCHQSLFSDFATSIKRVKSNNNPEDAAKLELDEYLKMDCIELTEDPLCWWKTYEPKFPALYQVVQNLFCIPATSVPCERIFSKRGQIYAEKRSKLVPKKMSQILFLQDTNKDL